MARARVPFRLNRKRPDTSLALAPRARAAATPDVLLQVDNARKQFGGVIAVNDVSFDVQAREIVALIGPNGAGKSTTFNLITGRAHLLRRHDLRSWQEDRQRDPAAGGKARHLPEPSSTSSWCRT